LLFISVIKYDALLLMEGQVLLNQAYSLKNLSFSPTSALNGLAFTCLCIMYKLIYQLY